MEIWKPNKENNLDKLLKKYEAERTRFQENLEKISQPLGHGTTSEHLRDILEEGLGTKSAENAIAKTISLTDLNEKDGLLGAYLFAKMGRSNLQIESNKVNGKDVVSRYVDINPRINEKDLRKKLKEYQEKKKPEGFPVLLIYSGSESNTNHSNPNIPSEIELEKPLQKQQLKIVLTPDENLHEINKLLNETDIEPEIFSIEILEL